MSWLISLFLIAVGGAVFGGAYVLVSGLPDVSILKSAYPRVVLDRSRGRGGRPMPRVEFSKYRPAGWVPLEGVAPITVATIVISEDGQFYRHDGVDWEQLRTVIEEGVASGGEFRRGASTITQQVVKNVFLSREKTFLRKAREIFLARELEREFPKKKILEVYLNIIELGPGIFGVREGARHYFGKHPYDLTAKESAFLAMLLPNPIRYRESFRQRELTEYGCRIVRSLLEKLVITQRLTPEEMEEQWVTPLSFEEEFGCE